MTRPLTTLLAVLVFIANAFCACAGAARADASREFRGVEKQSSHCHPAAPDERAGCHDEKSNGHDGDSHTCGHCTGTLSADAPQLKSNIPSPLVTPVLFLELTSDHLAATGSLWGSVHGHHGLSPPLPPPTLINLSCSLNN
jgi:hypothetical protein